MKFSLYQVRCGLVPFYSQA